MAIARGRSIVVKVTRVVVWISLVYSGSYIVTYILCGAGVVSQDARQQLDGTLFAPVERYKSSKLPGSSIVQQVSSMAYHSLLEQPGGSP